MTTTTQPTIDLVSLLEQNTGFRAIGTANNRLHGKEYWGMCPYCSTGNDRFHVFPESAKPHWFCRVCKRSGDHIDVLTEFRGMSYVEACQELGLEPGQSVSLEASMMYDDAPPPEKWQSMGRTLLARAEQYLWSTAHHALEYLLKRGFSETTIKNARLGYIPLLPNGSWFTRSFEDWGLDETQLTSKQREKGCVRVPPGLIIPWENSGILWKLAIKRFEAGPNEQRYGQVVGSRDTLFNLDSLARNKPVVLCEGELDCLSVLQEARDLVVPLATGSTSKARIPMLVAQIASLASCSLIAFDSDQAGDQASSFWLETLPKSMRWIPFSHDCNQMLQDGLSIRDWIQMGLSILEVKPDESPLQGTTIEDTLSLTCSVCNNPVEYYSPEGTAFCGECWQKLYVSTTKTQHCVQCGQETMRDESDGRCSYCYKDSLQTANPPREPVATRNRWSR